MSERLSGPALHDTLFAQRGRTEKCRKVVKYLGHKVADTLEKYPEMWDDIAAEAAVNALSQESRAMVIGMLRGSK